MEVSAKEQLEELEIEQNRVELEISKLQDYKQRIVNEIMRLQEVIRDD